MSKKKLILPDSIKNEDDAKEFLTHLWETGKDFHPDDSAASVIEGATGERLFTDEEAAKVDALMSQIFRLTDFDPYKFSMELDGHVMEE